MLNRSIQWAVGLMVVAVAMAGTGCIAVSGPGLGLLSIPIPVSPYHQKLREDRFEIHDLHATMLHLLGIDHTRSTFRFGGRDMRLTDVHGHLIEAALA